MFREILTPMSCKHNMICYVQQLRGKGGGYGASGGGGLVVLGFGLVTGGWAGLVVVGLCWCLGWARDWGSGGWMVLGFGSTT